MEDKLTLVGHLDELRKRILVSLISFIIASCISFPFAPLVLKILKLPAVGLIEKFVFFSPQEAFLIYMRIAIFLGFALALPVIIYEVWKFISPAIEPGLKKRGGIFVFSFLCSFIAGAVFAYFILIPPALRFLLSFGSSELEPFISADKYISFIIAIMLGCGAVFEMPILSLILTKLGLINARALRKKYKYALVVIVIIAAVITPTVDLFNLTLMAFPMVLLYEISIWVSFFAGPRR